MFNLNNNLGLAKKIKYSFMIFALGVILSYLMAQILIIGWYQAVSLTTELFTKPADEVKVTVPHAQETIDNLLRWNFGKEAKLAYAVFKSESGLRCGAEGDKHLTFQKGGITYGASYGIAQIRYLPGRPTPTQLKDCKFNIQYAKQLRDKQGWTIWSAFNNKNYLKNI